MLAGVPDQEEKLPGSLIERKSCQGRGCALVLCRYHLKALTGQRSCSYSLGPTTSDRLVRINYCGSGLVGVSILATNSGRYEITMLLPCVATCEARACISLTLLAVANATRKRVFCVRSLICACSNGSNGADTRYFRTTSTFQGGTNCRHGLTL